MSEFDSSSGGGGGGGGGLSPEAFLARTSDPADREALRTAAGLSNAKVKALVSLSEAYCGGGSSGGDGPFLSDAILLDPSLAAEDATALLCRVRGVGPWSASM
jgi:3-methyladenine DNA glycosylase/8-oxoguanine DNA glycosylase